MESLSRQTIAMNKMITSLEKNQIFVFGSNLGGAHCGGAAKQALKMFGARSGKGEGMQGQSYAFPTLDSQLDRLTVGELIISRNRLYACCEKLPKYDFLLTKVGCGIAGYSEDHMKSLFTNPPKNLVLPEDWK